MSFGCIEPQRPVLTDATVVVATKPSKVLRLLIGLALPKK
jgi:hypothetical protein